MVLHPPGEGLGARKKGGGRGEEQEGKQRGDLVGASPQST